MNALINPYTVVVAFALLILVLDFWKPQAARLILGVFFLVMALGVNLPLAITNPSLYAAAGEHALLPVYRWFFTTVLARNPVVFVIPLIAYELTVGALILSRGKAVRYGLLLGTLFCLGLTPVGLEEITSPALALGLVLLLRCNFERSLIDLIAACGGKKARPVA